VQYYGTDPMYMLLFGLPRFFLMVIALNLFGDGRSDGPRPEGPTASPVGLGCHVHHPAVRRTRQASLVEHCASP